MDHPSQRQHRRLVRRALTVGILYLTLAAAALAGSLRDDYRATVMKRQALEKKRSEYSVAIKSRARNQRKLTFSLYKCVTSRNGDEWAALLEAAQEGSDELETERVRINELRKSIGAIRATLEKRRVEIEKQHRRKGEGTPYETAFRQYMADLEATYFQRIETALFSGYEDYLSHLDAHIDFLKKSLSKCRNDGDG